MRLIIVSNRAPVNIKKENGEYRYEESPGGLATGLRAYVERLKKKDPEMEITWIGWPGAAVDDADKEKVKKEISKKHGTHCVFLSEEVMEKFYEGFCNKTIWPLFHYFPAFAVYEKENWEQYILVNQLFTDALFEIAKPGDVIWIHDYHLMLMPAMVRKKCPMPLSVFSCTSRFRAMKYSACCRATGASKFCTGFMVLTWWDSIRTITGRIF